MWKVPVVAAAAALALAACSVDSGGGGGSAASGGGGDSGGGGGDETITVGFAQVGAESGWRTANTKSIKETLTPENGVDLKFSDAQQKQENQISAIRSYIAQGVDVIAFSPVVESGWDQVLQEAKDADIPVVLTDRAVDSQDTSLYVTFLGSDFVEEGKKAGDWLVKEVGDAPTRVVELQGTTGSAPAIDRQKGFADAIAPASNIEIIDSQTGDFTRDGGKKVMEGFLNKYPDGIDVVFAHNDDMGLGAMEAIEAAGLKPGEDIKIITIDAVKDGMTALSEGKFNFIVECNPLLGPQLLDVVKKISAGEDVPPRIVTEETTFTQEQATEALPDRQY
jgi:ABC-type sugar transport system substrate-binding protein